jgi:tetratricopeptide (TPR) repeat protein
MTFHIIPIFRLYRLFAAWVCVLSAGLLMTSLGAQETPSLAEQQGAMFDRIEEMTDFGELTRNPKLDPQKLAGVLQLLRDSESLFPESEEEFQRNRYIFERLHYLSVAAVKTKDVAEKDALYDECEQVTKKIIMDPDDRKSVLEQINDSRLYGHSHDPEQMRTVEDALKIPKPGWRNNALNTIAQSLSRQEPPDFAEAIRAACAISDEDVNRGNCLSIIAVRQARAGLFDDAGVTYQLITENPSKKLSTLLTFAVIHDEHGDAEAAKRRIDEAFTFGYVSKDSSAFIRLFFQYCFSCTVRMRNPELVRYIFDKMIPLKKERNMETQKILAEFKAGIRTSHTISKMDPVTDTLTFAKTAARLGEHETAQQYFDEAKELLEESKPTNSLYHLDNHQFIAALYDAGFETRAQKELDDHIMITLHEKRFSHIVGDLLSKLAGSGRFSEIVAIVKAVQDDEERFKLYDHIVFLVCTRYGNDYGNDERVEMVVRKHLTSPQVLDIAGMLTDEPGGKSLESYREKLRRFADHLPKN